MVSLLKTIKLNGHSLTLDEIKLVAYNKAKIALDESAFDFIKKGSDLIEEWVNKEEVIYGITTGFGDLSKVKIPAEKSKLLQENLIKSHASGVGESLPKEIVRTVMLLRINTLIRGFSGITLETLNLLVELLNRDICPIIPSQGSVGASGDLAPLAHMALALIGEGKALYKEKILNIKDIFKAEGLTPTPLNPKEGLALINGTPVMTAIGALATIKALNLVKIADIAAATSLEALRGVPYAFDEKIHELRPHPGQRIVAQNIRKLIKKSQIIQKYKKQRVQDAYSLRCVPQVHGAIRDALDFVKSKIEIEINSVTDNPIIFPEEKIALSGGNFHGEPIAIAMDLLSIAMAELANISERRVARLVDNHLSGLPHFLTPQGGINSGFMIPQYVCASIVSENKVLAHPASVDSIPTSANQEDHVSMGTYAARKAYKITENTQKVLGIEILTACQGLDFLKPLEPGEGVKAAYKQIRKEIPFLEKDDILYQYITKAIDLIENPDFIKNIEDAIGKIS